MSEIMPVVFLIDTRHHMLVDYKDGKSKMNMINKITRELFKTGIDRCTAYSDKSDIDFCVFNLSGDMIIDWQSLLPYREYFKKLSKDNSKIVDLGYALNSAVDCIMQRKHLYFDMGIVGLKPEIIVLSDFDMLNNNFNLSEKAKIYLIDNQHYAEKVDATFIWIEADIDNIPYVFRKLPENIRIISEKYFFILMEEII